MDLNYLPFVQVWTILGRFVAGVHSPITPRGDALACTHWVTKAASFRRDQSGEPMRISL
jgi:hypothetical protein